MNSMLWMISVLILLTLLIIPVESLRYRKLKKEIEKPHSKRNIKTTSGLLYSYNDIYYQNRELFRASLLHLRIKKEEYAKESLFEDFFKMVTSLVPIVAIVISLTTMVFKNSVDTLSTFYGAIIDLAAWLFLAVVFFTIISRLYIYSYSKATLIINKHLIVAEDVEKHPQERNIYTP